MDHLLITVADDDIKEGVVVETIEDRLEKGLFDEARVVGIALRQEQEATIELLDWLESWTARFAEKGKQLVAVAGTPDQFEALELSHPEQGLSYYSSIEEWEAVFPRQPEPPAPAPQPAAARSDCSMQPDWPEPLNDPIFSPTVETGGIVTISGEYQCLGCGARRTWLKGDTMEACDNVECLNPKSGWKLSCDLF